MPFRPVHVLDRFLCSPVERWRRRRVRHRTSRSYFHRGFAHRMGKQCAESKSLKLFHINDTCTSDDRAPSRSSRSLKFLHCGLALLAWTELASASLAAFDLLRGVPLLLPRVRIGVGLPVRPFEPCVLRPRRASSRSLRRRSASSSARLGLLLQPLLVRLSDCSKAEPLSFPRLLGRFWRADAARRPASATLLLCLQVVLAALGRVLVRGGVLRRRPTSR